MLAEVHYWRDMARILEAVTEELRQPFVEVVVQILQALSEEEHTKALAEDVSVFLKEKARVIKGLKEAKWNNKYMKIIEKPVKTIEQAKELKEIVLNIGALMNSLQNIFLSSNFYKENRILSFLDRLLTCIQGKIRQKVGLQITINQAVQGSYDDFDFKQLSVAMKILTRYNENFFMRTKELHTKNEEAKMGQSFYKQDGLDFLAFSYSDAFAKTNLRVYTRAEKIEQQVGYMQDLLRFFQFAGKTAKRFSDQLSDLADQPDLKQKIKSFLELYQVYSPEYDMYDAKYKDKFSLFVVSCFFH